MGKKKALVNIFLGNPVVFISHSPADSKEAARIKKLAEKYLSDVFVAPAGMELAGDSKENIKSNIDCCDIFVPIISQQSAKSPFEREEIRYAASRSRKSIIPVLKGKLRREDLKLHVDIRCVGIESRELERMLRNRIFRYYAWKVGVYVLLSVISLLLLLSGILRFLGIPRLC